MSPFTDEHEEEYQRAAGGRKLFTDRPDDDSVPASHVLIVCLGVVALIAIVIWL